MKILVDENTDEELPEFMPAHDVYHVKTMGWQGTKNGELLGKAQDAGFELFLTADKNMPYQQRMKGRPSALVVLDIHPNILANQSACVPIVEARLGEFKPGQVYLVEGPHSKRKVH